MNLTFALDWYTVQAKVEDQVNSHNSTEMKYEKDLNKGVCMRTSKKGRDPTEHLGSWGREGEMIQAA